MCPIAKANLDSRPSKSFIRHLHNTVAQRCFHGVISTSNIAYSNRISLALQSPLYSAEFLTCGVVVADGEDGRGPTVGATATILQIRLAICIAFLRCRLTGRGAIISVAADGGRIAPYHLTVMAPTLEL